MILNGFIMGGINAYTISKASDSFLKQYPKAWIACSISRNEVVNVDKLSDLKYGLSEVSYLFANRKPTVKNSINDPWQEIIAYTSAPVYEDILSVYPFDGHNFFIGDQDGSDLILKIVPKEHIIDPRLMNSIVIRNKCSYMKQVDFKKSIPQLLKTIYNKKYLDSVNTTEKWLKAFLKELPFGLYNQPFKFPELINDSLFKRPLNLGLNNFAIGYCMRTDLKSELEMVHELEKQTTPLNKRITIFENYNGIAKRIAKAAREQKMKYKHTPGISIEIKVCDLFKLKLGYSITDFIK